MFFHQNIPEEPIYETLFYFSLWLLVIWIGAAMIAMELAFVPWTDLHGGHY